MLNYLKRWGVLFIKDITRKEFIPIKILSVLILGGLTALFPFMTIHARSLGINEEEIGIVYSILPLIGIFIPAISGILADKIGNFKVYLCIAFGTAGLLSLLMFVIPPARATHILPERVPVNVTCHPSGLTATIADPYTCDFSNSTDFQLKIKKCRNLCHLEQDVVHTLPKYKTKWSSITNDYRSNHIDIEEEIDLEEDDFILNKTAYEVSPKELNVKFKPGSDNASLILMKSDACFTEVSGVAVKNCWLECVAYIERDKACQNEKSIEVFDPFLTLSSYISFRMVHGIASSTSMSLFEGATIAIVNEHNGDIGFQRVYLNIGMVIMTPISGIMIDHFSTKDKVDFSPAVYLYFCLIMLSAIIILFVDLEFKQPCPTVFKQVKKLLSDFEVICFILVAFVSGCFLGFLETFFFWLLEDLGADKKLMGITITVGALSGIPVMILSTSIIKKLGHTNTISLSMSVFAVRFLGYSLISDPWMAMIFETLECFTLCLLGIVAASYVSVLTTPFTVVTLQGMFSGTHWGVGKGGGSLIGGYLIKHLGIRTAFRVLSLVCVVCSVLYFWVTHTFFRNRRRPNQDSLVEEAANNKDAPQQGEQPTEKLKSGGLSTKEEVKDCKSCYRDNYN